MPELVAGRVWPAHPRGVQCRDKGGYGYEPTGGYDRRDKVHRRPT